MHEITTDDHGTRHGTDGQITVSLREKDGRMFKRRAIRMAPEASEECWLVAEVDGVRVYQQGFQIIVTREDLWP
jgi:hypothetical protein